MKVYRGGVNRHVLSFVFPMIDQLVLSLLIHKNSNSSAEFQRKTIAKAFINAACRIPESVHLEMVKLIYFEIIVLWRDGWSINQK